MENHRSETLVRGGEIGSKGVEERKTGGTRSVRPKPHLAKLIVEWAIREQLAIAALDQGRIKLADVRCAAFSSEGVDGRNSCITSRSNSKGPRGLDYC